MDIDLIQRANEAAAAAAGDQVYIEDEHIVIKVGYEYDIALNRCDTPEKILEWSWQLCEKNWMTPSIIRRFISLAAEQHGIDIHQSA